MRRIAIAITTLGLLAQLIGCAADAPTAPKPGGGNGNGNGALQVTLFTNNANPPAGSCSLLQAIATLNGSNVPDGTGIAFSTNLGSFAQNSQPQVSVVTSGGAATTSVCSPQSGVATVKAATSVQGKNGSTSLPIAFQPSANAATVTSCSPSFGSPNGGTAVTLSGTGFYGSAGTTTVAFTAAGVTRNALVTAVSSTAIGFVTPAFPEANSLAVPVQIQVTLGAGTASPETVAAPNCFAFGTTPVGTPSITAVLPSSGKNDGNTRVTIVGSGFVAPVQVFFGNVEASVQSISYNQIVALSPPAFGVGAPNLNQTVDIRVHEVNTGQDAVLTAAYKYGPALQLIGFQGTNAQPVIGPFTPLTILGQGFEAPVSVSLAGFIATVVSVSATEIVVVPGNILVNGCSDVAGAIVVTNLNTGDTSTANPLSAQLTFTYLVTETAPIITGVNPPSANVPAGGLDVTITGANLFNPVVTVGGAQVPVTSASASGTSITVHIPPTAAAPPACGTSAPGTLLPVGGPLDVTVKNLSTTCVGTFPGAFQYVLPCQ